MSNPDRASGPRPGRSAPSAWFGVEHRLEARPRRISRSLSVVRRLFLVARDRSLLVLDDTGKTQEFYRAEKMVHDPRVIRPRLREPVLPTRAEWQKTTGQLVLTDIYRGRNMAGVKPGTIKKLLVLEDLPKPGSKHGLPGYHGGYNL